MGGCEQKGIFYSADEGVAFFAGSRYESLGVAVCYFRK